MVLHGFSMSRVSLLREQAAAKEPDLQDNSETRWAGLQLRGTAHLLFGQSSFGELQLYSLECGDLSTAWIAAADAAIRRMLKAATGRSRPKL